MTMASTLNLESVIILEGNFVPHQAEAYCRKASSVVETIMERYMVTVAGGGGQVPHLMVGLPQKLLVKPSARQNREKTGQL